MSDKLIFDSERQEQRALRKRRLLPILVLVGILILAVVVALLIRSGRGEAHAGGGNTVYPFTWLSKSDGRAVLEIGHENAKDYRWVLNEGWERYGVVEAERAQKEKSGKTCVTLTPVKAGRAILILTLERPLQPEQSEGQAPDSPETEGNGAELDPSADEGEQSQIIDSFLVGDSRSESTEQEQIETENSFQPESTEQIGIETESPDRTEATEPIRSNPDNEDGSRKAQRGGSSAAETDRIYRMTILIENEESDGVLRCSVLEASGCQLQSRLEAGQDTEHPYRFYLDDKQRLVVAVTAKPEDDDWFASFASGEKSVILAGMSYEQKEVSFTLEKGSEPGDCELLLVSYQAAAELRLKLVHKTDGSLLVTEHQLREGTPTIPPPEDNSNAGSAQPTEASEAPGAMSDSTE